MAWENFPNAVGKREADGIPPRIPANEMEDYSVFSDGSNVNDSAGVTTGKQSRTL